MTIDTATGRRDGRLHDRRFPATAEPGLESGAGAEGRSYVIETDDATAGVVFEQSNGFLFIAANSDFAALDGRIFLHPSEAVRAARRLQAGAAGSSDRRARGPRRKWSRPPAAAYAP